MKKSVLLSIAAMFLVVCSHAQRPGARMPDWQRDRDRAATEYNRDIERARVEYERDVRDAEREYYRDTRDNRNRGFIHPQHRGYYQKGWYYYNNKHSGKKWQAYKQCNCPHCGLYFRPQHDRRYNYYDHDRYDFHDGYRRRESPAPYSRRQPNGRRNDRSRRGRN